eukprot:12516801-Ditylum_brightwellii.AAC.1
MNINGIVVLDEKERKALFIDVTVPMDINMIKAAVGALGTICQNLDGLLAWVSPRANLDLIQKNPPWLSPYSAPYINGFS